MSLPRNKEGDAIVAQSVNPVVSIRKADPDSRFNVVDVPNLGLVVVTENEHLFVLAGSAHVLQTGYTVSVNPGYALLVLEPPHIGFSLGPSLMPSVIEGDDRALSLVMYNTTNGTKEVVRPGKVLAILLAVKKEAVALF